MKYYSLILCLFLYVFNASSNVSKEEDLAQFAGRISRLNKIAKLMRVKIDFENAKFINPNNRIEFWNETYPQRKCQGVVEGKSTEYILIKVSSYAKCISSVHVTVGTYLHLYSPDLASNLGLAKELVEILLKKRLALASKARRYEKELEIHIEKVDAVNKRYEILRQKLDIELQNELLALDEDKSRNFMHFQYAKTRLNELDHKLHRYRIEDQNLKEDRWALDPRLYLKK